MKGDTFLGMTSQHEYQISHSSDWLRVFQHVFFMI